MVKKTVFIGHPIGGDVQGNMTKVLAICAQVHTQEEDVIPVAPYLVSLQYLNDSVESDRALGMEANHECFRRGYVDELRLYGDRISDGMRGEIVLANLMDIPVFPMTEGTMRDFAQFKLS